MSTTDFFTGFRKALQDVLVPEIKVIQTEIKHLNEKIDRNYEEMNKRFEQVDKRFEQVDKRFDAMHEEIMKLIIGQREIISKLDVSRQ